MFASGIISLRRRMLTLLKLLT